MSTAVLLVDMQNESGYGYQRLDAVVAATARVTAAARAAGVPVLYTRHVSRPDAVGLSNGELLDDAGLPVYYRDGTPAVDVLPGIEPQPGDVVVDKHRWSGFHGTSLDLLLRGLGTRRLLVGGFTTDCCVLTTVYDAYARDYQVTLVEDMCAATTIGAHQAAVLTLGNWVYDLEVTTATQAVRLLEGRPHRAWRSTAPDQLQFDPETLDATFASLLAAIEEPAAGAPAGPG